MAFLPRNHNATGVDPNSLQRKEGRSGGTGDKNNRGEFATVIAYQPDRYTATVKTERGRTIKGVPRLRNAPGDVSTLASGTEVLISYEYGPPIIMGVLSVPASNNDSTATFSASETEGFGGQGLNQSTQNVGNFRNATEPRDLLPGDDVRVGKDGNLIGLLEGGMSVLKSSTLSQIRTHLINDMVEIFSRNFRHVTDMGEFNITNNDGRINLSFRGGTDQRNEAGPDEENWTILFDLGAEGDVLNFELTTPNGQTLFRFHVDAEGHAELYGINGVDLLSGSRNNGSHTEEHTGNSYRKIAGNREAQTKGSESRTVDGDRKEQTGGDLSSSVGNDYRVQVLRDTALSSGRNMFVSAQGGEGPSALAFEIENGNWTTNLGSATSPDSGFDLTTQAGDISMSSALGGNVSLTTPLGNIETSSQQIKLKTSLPDSVILGGSTLVSHLVKYEELQAHLANLYAALDNHTHLITGTATAGPYPVVGLTAAPTVPIGSPLTSSMLNFKSTKAGVSG